VTTALLATFDQDRPQTVQEALQALMPVLGITAALGLLIWQSRPGGALSEAVLSTEEEDSLNSLERAEAAIQAIDSCRPAALSALQVAQREIGKAEVLGREITDKSARKNALQRASSLSRKAATAGGKLSRCITAR
jgi:hypothetical protein